MFLNTPLHRATVELKAQLQKQKFDVTAANPAVAWQAFKEWIQVPVEWKTVAVGVEFLHFSDRDDILYLEFSRRLEDENGGAIDVGCLFSREVPQEMRATNKSYWWQIEDGDLLNYFAEVENTLEFEKCMALGDWQLES